MGITQLRNLLTNRYKCKHVYNYHISPDITSARNAVDIRKPKVIDMKQTVEKASIEYAESVIRSFGTCGVPNGISDIKEMIVNGFNSGAEWQKEKAIEALSSVLEDWVHGGDADCIIAEFEEKLK